MSALAKGTVTGRQIEVRAIPKDSGIDPLTFCAVFVVDKSRHRESSA